MEINMEDKKLMKCLIPCWKGSVSQKKKKNVEKERDETLSSFLIVVINELKCIGVYIGLNTFINNFHIHWWVNDFFIMEDEELFIHLMD